MTATIAGSSCSKPATNDSARRVHACRAVTAGHEVRVAVPQAQMRVRAVAGVGTDLWGERRDQAVAPRHRAHRLAHDHRRVGGRQRIAGSDRHLELAVRVLGVELLQTETLRLHHRHEVEREVLVLNERDVAVARTMVRRMELAVIASDPHGELELEHRLHQQTSLGERVGHAPRECPWTGSEWLAGLRVLIHRGPCPPRHRGERHGRARIGPEPKVAGGSVDVAGQERELIVRHRHVEKGGEPDA